MMSCDKLKATLSQQFCRATNLLCRVDVTLYYDCKIHRHCNKDIFGLTTCELLCHVASCCAAFRGGGLTVM